MKIKALIVLLSGAVLLYSCRGNSGYSTLEDNTTDTALVAADSTEFAQAKLVKTADLTFTVKNVEQAAGQISALARQYQGLVTHHHMRSFAQNTKVVRINRDSVMRVAAYSTEADMTVKVPSEKLDEFMNKVGQMGTHVMARNMDIEDQSLIYLESQLKLNSRKELVTQQKKGRIKLKAPEDALIFKDALVDEQVNTRRIDDAVKYSVVSLNFSQNNTVMKEIIVNDDVSDYRGPFFSRLGLAMQAGINLFTDVIVGLADFWLFLLAGIIIWILVARLTRKHTVLPLTKH
ncbi:DUF4349 domain-containing protein [Mucilaginibacter limnophilus]|uniref:DUF4349 domain-containing protein n=1 Tax=Mucilaginibacter limnophilus TaxID=1932778 RepID=A0A3S2V910_9SPHI|nr:DUF4349 domain-containing protein [Mucilaginibacter limnophilus]RVU01592.1 DUF4349 domain-containing protein [Mucilaginibacter limnophilus]